LSVADYFADSRRGREAATDRHPFPRALEPPVPASEDRDRRRRADAADERGVEQVWSRNLLVEQLVH